MATTISGPVILPDGSIPTHGRVIFQAHAVIFTDTVVLPGRVYAPINSGQISVALEGLEEGTTYSAVAEYWSEVEGKLRRDTLPNIVVTGAGDGTLADLSVVEWVEMMAPYKIKRGDTLSLGGIWLDHLDRAASLVDVVVEASMKGSDDVLKELVVTIDNDPSTGRYQLYLAPAETEALSLGAYAIDIKFTRSGEVSHSSTGTIIIEREITA